MKISTTFRVSAACLVMISAAALWLRADEAPKPVQPAAASAYRIGTPISHENLTIYPLLGDDRVKEKHYLTLAEAMEQKLIKVYETGNVNQLAIENTSKDRDVYVQSGDIVKGGRQDRTIAMDFICPPGAKLPIDAFCVEHGRWSQRGKEQSAEFSSAGFQVSSNALKVAVKDAQNQSEVWKQVDQVQRKASGNVGEKINAAESDSSLQLSLENKKLQEMTEQYIKAMSNAADQPNTIGFAFAINGQIKSADVYASHELFMKLWPKMLRATAVEAVADLQKGKSFDVPSQEMLSDFVLKAESGKTSDRKVTDRVTMQTRDGEKHLLYETRDAEVKPAAASAEWIHRNYLLKDDETRAALAAKAQGQGQRSIRQQQEAQQVDVQAQRKLDESNVGWNRIEQRPATQPAR